MYKIVSIVLILFCSIRLQAQSPHGDAFKIDCAACHDASGWTTIKKPLLFDHDSTNFALEGRHAAINCKECHTSFVFSEAPLQCSTCHTDVHNMSVGNDCARCHTSQNWLVDNIPELHEQKGFPLFGSHSNLNCIECHASETNLNFTSIGNDCINCHLTEYTNTSNPNHQLSDFSTNCIDCHDPIRNGWESDIIGHEFFPLTGGHDIQDCKQCHISKVFSDASPECMSCHSDNYSSTTSPDHVASQIPTDCKQCHNENAWTPSSFDHSMYPFVGAHAPIANNCNLCHHGNYANTPNTCEACHLPDYTATTNPNHSVSQLPTDCKLCHDETAWTPSSFDHSIYPFVGAHAPIANNCNLCHLGNYVNTPNTCEGCHLPDYTATTNPNHSVSQLPTDCKLCHDETAWAPSRFDHSIYPFIGAHSPIANDCNLCHNGNYVNTPNTCDGCHMPDYTATVNPNHSAAQFPTDCAVCHNESAWMPAGYSHTNFPLLGAHATIASCNDCHHGNYTNTANTCDACHMPDYNASVNPNHSTAQFPTDCAVCHNETAWVPSGFTHNTFPLLGAHATVSNCNDCHHGNFTNTPNTCDACHMPDYNATANPNHSAAQFPTDCAVCHNESAWLPSGFTHSSFPLLGAHAAVSNCNDCHHGNFTNTPNTCDACHMPDYNATTNPNHSSAQFPTDCAVCHNESAWNPSGFTHSSFPLLGAHAAVSNCNDCHHGNFTTTPNTCSGCHMPDYNGTTNPNHSASQFSTNCTDCHTETAWSPSSFNHDANYFPIYSGNHNGEWNTCADCHTNSGNYAIFSCIDCHEHDNQTSVNDDHNGVSGYSYNSTACLNCHPNGN